MQQVLKFIYMSNQKCVLQKNTLIFIKYQNKYKF